MEKTPLKVTLLDGDGIGPEVNAQAVKALTAIGASHGIAFEFNRGPIGGASIRESGSPLTDETISICLSSDAVLLGAVGSPEFDHLDPSVRPEAGLLRLRKELGGFANLRPAFAVPELLDASPLKKEIAEKTDLLIVRELLGGLYFGEPRGFAPDRCSAYNTLTYTSGEIERVARIAFGIARKRRGKLTSVDKANVLETSRLWRSTVDAISEEFPDVEVDHLFVDACAMHLVTSPERFDVILTENLFGDILSDEASILCGSLGMLASATIGGRVDLYEPVHGSAPDIAGEDKANPLGAIESVAMLLEHTGENIEAAGAIRSAVRRVLRSGHRTQDIAAGAGAITTSQMGDLVSAEILGSQKEGTARAA